uniref:Uncharacterized protein n=1 Tax=Rhizophora mucronata TaxID=61149 RepID=A0A2P2QAV4_RHIMU
MGSSDKSQMHTTFSLFSQGDCIRNSNYDLYVTIE